MCNWVVFTLSILFLIMCFVTDCQRGRLLGSKTLGTKYIRTSFCICWQTMIKTMSLGLGLLKVCLSVSLNRVFCRSLLCKIARLDRSKIRLDRSRIGALKILQNISNTAQVHMTCRVESFMRSERFVPSNTYIELSRSRFTSRT